MEHLVEVPWIDDASTLRSWGSFHACGQWGRFSLKEVRVVRMRCTGAPRLCPIYRWWKGCKALIFLLRDNGNGANQEKWGTLGGKWGISFESASETLPNWESKSIAGTGVAESGSRIQSYADDFYLATGWRGDQLCVHTE